VENVSTRAGTAPDAERMLEWIADVVDPSVTSVTIGRMDGGHSSGAWRIDALGAGGSLPMVLKAPEMPSVVHKRDACREASIMAAAAQLGAPVAAVIAIDGEGRALDRPSFLLEYVDGRSVPDTVPGYHAHGWLREAGLEEQRAIWESFHDALAALHSIQVNEISVASHGPDGLADVLRYWRAALLDIASAKTVPRQLWALAWLEANLPVGANNAPALCMGDARLVNGLVKGSSVQALVDFEVAYIGNPAADIGYSLFFDDLQRRSADLPLAGFPSKDQTWERWSRQTGRLDCDREFWTAFGATVLCVTATRAMIQWGLSGPTVESDNSIVSAWEAAIERVGK
jgi:aminoglycoside phosphotransferase (APT) family kinase protein